MNSPGEERFAVYLDQQGLSYQYQAPVGGKHPDFLVSHSSGEVACEVYEPKFKLPPGRTGSFDLYPALRRAFKDRKYEQAQAARSAELPFVLVLAGTNSDMGFDPLIVAGAMFGDISVPLTIALDPELPAPEQKSGFVFGGGAPLQETQKRAVSAVALPRTFNPTRQAVILAYRERKQAIGGGDPAGWSVDERAQAWELMLATFDEFTAKGLYDDDARVCRVIVLHNPYCDIPVDGSVFSGSWDEQFGVRDDGAYALVAEAERAYELPD